WGELSVILKWVTNVVWNLIENITQASDLIITLLRLTHKRSTVPALKRLFHYLSLLRCPATPREGQIIGTPAMPRQSKL
ncbi:MAG: hypothetical protein FWE02_02620, partial [Defluviitaleaceae bacterium]|nr:hypothetical protein [Defluviitaleaceae bacterium]